MDLFIQIMRQAEEFPDRTAHLSDGRQLTYRELSSKARVLAASLQKERPGAPVMLVGHKECEMIIGFLAADLCGRPYVPVDTALPPDRVSQIVSALDAPTVLTPALIRERIRNAEEAGLTFVPDTIPDSAPCYIMFTSGSTGKPKGVVISRASLRDFVDWMLGEHEIPPGSAVFLNQAPFSFDLSIMDLYMSLATAGTLFSITRDQIAEPAVLFRTLKGSGISVWVSTPSFAQLCLQDNGFNESFLPSLRKILFCGEPLGHALAAELIARFPNTEVWNTYGPTEATVATTSIRITPELLARYRQLPIGISKPRSKLLVMSDTLEELPAGERGELVIVGPNVAIGYFKDPERTGKAFFTHAEGRAYRTGDAGHEKDGLLFCEGRQDFQIKFHGYRIELGDIEENLRAIGGVRDAVVIPKANGGPIEYLAAFILRADGASGEDRECAASLKRELGKRVPSYMVPQRFLFLSSYPMNANGKTDRKALAGTLP